MPDPIPIEPELLRTSEVAAMLGLSERHFEAMAASGRIGPKPVQLGRAKRWPRRELIRWIESGCVSRERWIRSAEQSAAPATNPKARSSKNL